MVLWGTFRSFRALFDWNICAHGGAFCTGGCYVEVTLHHFDPSSHAEESEAVLVTCSDAVFYFKRAAIVMYFEAEAVGFFT